MSYSKDNDPVPPKEKEVDVYAVGTESSNDSKTIAKLWKNGVATHLSDGVKSARTYDVFVVER